MIPGREPRNKQKAVYGVNLSELTANIRISTQSRRESAKVDIDKKERNNQVFKSKIVGR